jgi:ABC-type antimicrobial peptide transport system permease subunit
MTTVLGASVAERRFALRLIGAFAVIALLLAAIGISGVVAQVVTQRTMEIGIRMALGATAADVVRMVIRDGAGLAAWGVGFGLAGAWAAARVARGLLFETSPADPATYLGVAVLLAAVAMLASAPPAWRAMRLDPIRAIREA